MVALNATLECFGVEIDITVGLDSAAQPAFGLASQFESDFRVRSDKEKQRQVGETHSQEAQPKNLLSLNQGPKTELKEERKSRIVICLSLPPLLHLRNLFHQQLTQNVTAKRYSM